MQKKNYITPAGFKRLEDEYSYLTKIERPRIVDIVSWAASLGDRSENADYIYGKKRLREIDRRLRFLAKRINFAFIVDPVKQSSDKIVFGATVKLSDEQAIEKVVSVVGIDEIDAENGLVSWESPLACALLQKEVGDEVKVRSPQGEVVYFIVGFEYKEISIKGFESES